MYYEKDGKDNKDTTHVEYYKIILKTTGKDLRNEEILMGVFQSLRDADTKQKEIYEKVRKECEGKADVIKLSYGVSRKRTTLRYYDKRRKVFNPVCSNIFSYFVRGYDKYFCGSLSRMVFSFVIEKHTINETLDSIDFIPELFL